MTKTITSLLIAVALATCFTSCKTTGNVQADVSGFWNSQAVQDELAQIENEAIKIINLFVSSHIGTARTGNILASRGAKSAVDKAVADIKSRHPNVPESVIRNTVTAKLAAAGG